MVRRVIATNSQPTTVTLGSDPPKVTVCATEEDLMKRFASWTPPYRHPDTRVKKMLAVVLSIAIKVIMKNHVYSFDGKMRKQSKGGPIGLDLTGDLAHIFMM